MANSREAAVDNDASEQDGLAYHAETDSELRLWSIFFLSRQIGGAAALIAVAGITDFGDSRYLVAAVGFGLVLPFDLWLHWRARQDRRVPWLSVLAMPIAPAFVLWEPVLWVPAVLGSLATIGLYGLAYRMPVPAVLAVVQAAVLAAAGLIADVDGFAQGMVAYLLTGPALVVALSALFQAIVTSERRYHDFLEYANDIVYTHDLKTLKFLTVNEAALLKTGYTREELADITVADIVAPDNLGRAAEMIQRKVDGDADATTYDIDIMTKEGKRLPVEVSTRVIYRRGVPSAIQGIARDIGDRRNVEAQQLALDKARSEFIANAAHELRTPLTTLAGLASVLASTRDRMTEEEIAEAIAALDRQGRRARLLADKLLDLSSVELGSIDIVREPVDVAETVERALEDVPPPEGKRVTVEVEADLKALADAVRLQEILHNFLTNAYRYGGSSIAVSGTADDGSVLLSVTDDGPGVPPDLQPHLFEPFSRGDHGDSTGLGLAICDRLAEAQGGEALFEPVQPSGARFAVRLTAAS